MGISSLSLGALVVAIMAATTFTGCGAAEPTPIQSEVAAWPTEATGFSFTVNGTVTPTGGPCVPRTPVEPFSDEPVRFTYDVATRSLARFDCGAPLTPRARTLSNADAATLESFLSTLRVARGPFSCGTDSTGVSITISSSAGSTTYQDDFYGGCSGSRGPFLAGSLLSNLSVLIHQLLGYLPRDRWAEGTRAP